MNPFRPISLATAAIVLATIAQGCSQFSSLVQSEHATSSDAVRSANSNGIMHLGEDPDAFQSQIDPTERRANLLMTRAQLSLADGEPEAAAPLLESILEADPEHVEASHMTAVLRTQSGDLQAAEDHFQTALANDADNPQLNSDYGYFCYLVDRWDDAEQYLTRAIEIDPGLAEAHTNLGMLEARLGKPDSAAQRFRNAGCTEVEVLNNLAFARLLEEDLAVAEATYRDALERDPENRTANEGLQMTSHLFNAVSDTTAASSTVSVAAGTARLQD